MEMFDEAIDEQSFIGYLRRLARVCRGQKVALVMDNLSVHKTPAVKELMIQLKFEWIYNVPYSPQLNAIEFAFSQVKLFYKQLKLRALV